MSNAILSIIGSSSKGNGYLLTCNSQSLILECGTPVKDVLSRLNWHLENVVGCLATHEHNDHIGHIKQYLDYGLPVYSNADVVQKHKGVQELKPMMKYFIGGFTVVPLSVPHGDCPNYAYYIKMPDGQTLVFATDLTQFPYKLTNINHLLIEANYSDDIRVEALLNGAQLRSQSICHMELNKTIETIKQLARPHSILCHLSDGLSDEQMFKSRIFTELGIHAEIATAGAVFELTTEDF